MMSDQLLDVESRVYEQFERVSADLTKIMGRVAQPDFDPQEFTDTLSDFIDAHKELHEITDAIEKLRAYPITEAEGQ